MRAWIAGIISAAMGGASGVLGMLVADPKNFDLDHTGKIAKVAIFVAITHVVAYLARSPLPEATLTTSVSVPGPGGTTVKVSETHPINAPKDANL